MDTSSKLHTTIKTDYNDKESIFTSHEPQSDAGSSLSLGTELVAFKELTIDLQMTHATPPSSSGSSPSFTQSTSLTSTSSPSTSPPLPTTPPRSSRSRTRYPDLGRVPLHRRGTSKTYERLEDLLREAGYKETRVFTPEGERSETSSGKQDGHLSDQNQGSVRNSVGALVGFLAGLMPAASRSTSSLGTTTDAHSPPVSPVDQRKAQETERLPITPSLEPTPRANRLQPPSRMTTPVPSFTLNQGSQKSVHRASEQYHRSSSRRSTAPAVQPSPVPVAGSSYAQPQASRAGAYLRHIASAPNMAKRNTSTAERQRTFTPNETSPRQYENTQPPLPPSWLKTVARAVLSGGMGAYIGGPSSSTDSPPGPRGKTLRPTRSSLSQASTTHQRTSTKYRGLADTTNMKKAGNGAEQVFAPPGLFARIEHGRASTSAGEVCRTRVVCRSAPTSRVPSPSPMRGVADGAREREREKEKEKRERERRERAMKVARGRGRAGERRLPSLANTQTEGDRWVGNGRRVRDKGKRGAESRYLGGWGMDGGESSEGERIVSSEEEEEEGELDLARMLVNPKRQNSIVSLRRHLNNEENSNAIAGKRKFSGMSAGAGSRSGSVSVRQRIVEDEDWDGSEAEDWGLGWVRSGGARRVASEDEESHARVGFLGKGRVFGSGRSGGTGSSRLGIPGAWGLIGGGGGGGA